MLAVGQRSNCEYTEGGIPLKLGGGLGGSGPQRTPENSVANNGTVVVAKTDDGCDGWMDAGEALVNPGCRFPSCGSGA
jgi:hypothetical protein